MHLGGESEDKVIFKNLISDIVEAWSVCGHIYFAMAEIFYKNFSLNIEDIWVRQQLSYVKSTVSGFVLMGVISEILENESQTMILL